ncbi:MAG: hypothetical protein QGH83_07790 [Candidatus Pacebacteria bacterium]|jgi:hypothetical protein|nr:hypothetical protein [Candidatus Paceibacterota bacterium]|tara:strand:+ start:359 stop:1600 length:1242 start_codon:yes stop_codon:yes gene_type:complete
MCNIVDITKVKEFTEQHLNIVKNNELVNWEKAYPELFVEIPGAPALEFVGFILLPHDQFEITQQQYRAGSQVATNRRQAIQQNIERNGYKLKHPPIAVFFDGKNYHIITGNTRTNILRSSPFDTKNAIVAVYKRKPGYSDAKVEHSLDVAGLSMNSIHDPATPLQPADVRRIGIKATRRFLESKGEAGIPATFDDIREFVHHSCGEGVFQFTTREQLVFSIYNDFQYWQAIQLGQSTENLDIIISWSNSKAGDFNITQFMKDCKLDSDTKNIYMVNSTDTVSKAFVKAVKLAVQNPDAEIRIMLQTGTLSGYSLEHSYRNRCIGFVTKFEDILSDVCKSFFGVDNPLYNRIKIWGALPALGSYHDLTKPFRYNTKTRSFYQLNHNYSFDVDDIPELSDIHDPAWDMLHKEEAA